MAKISLGIFGPFTPLKVLFFFSPEGGVDGGGGDRRGLEVKLISD